MAKGDGRIYVYGFAEPGLPRTLRIRGRNLRTLSLGPVDVVAESSRDAVEPTHEALRDQFAVIAALNAKTAALIPARFGSTVQLDALRQLVSQHESTLLGALAQVRGRSQMTVRVFGPSDADGIKTLPAASGTAFLESRRARARHLASDVASIRDAVGTLAAAEVIEPGRHGLRVTVFHLVPERYLATYQARAAALRLDPHHVVVSGPSAAFAFAPELL